MTELEVVASKLESISAVMMGEEYPYSAEEECEFAHTFLDTLKVPRKWGEEPYSATLTLKGRIMVLLESRGITGRA